MTKKEKANKILEEFHQKSDYYSPVDLILFVMDYDKKRNKLELEAAEQINDFEKKEVFFEWIDYRKEIRKSIKSKRSFDKLVKQFNENDLNVVKAAVNASIENQYQGLFITKPKTNERNSNNQSRFEGFVQANSKRQLG